MLRTARHLALLTACGLGLSLVAETSAQAADLWPSRVRAVYDVEFNGFNVGTFEFNSSTDNNTYALKGAGKLSLLFGALKWTGDTEAAGKLANTGTAQPQSFAFGYKAQKKVGSTRMTFAGDTVGSVLHEPPKPPKPGLVPVRPEHLKGVFDPMSAILAVSKGTSENPCNRRIPIYDGKERFDLELSPKGIEQVTEKKPSGQPGTGYVCKVKYVPIAGHKMDQETKYMASSDAISITLRPIPKANIFVPYQVKISTIAGPATLTARTVDITTRDQTIALSH